MLIDELLERFQKEYDGGLEGVRVFFAPGRVNLIGEHTDYTGGYVFPAALTYGTWAVVRTRQDRRWNLFSTAYPTRVQWDPDGSLVARGWSQYPLGMIQEFASKGDFLGADMLFHGDLPTGVGLSSSASILMVTAVAVRNLLGFSDSISMMELARMAQYVENRYIGVQCGIMDPFAIGLGKADHALLLKTNTLEYQEIPLHLNNYHLVITNSNKKRELADSKYNERREECEKGFMMIRHQIPRTHVLGDVTLEQWSELRSHISSPLLERRLNHVISENTRVLASAEALQRGNLQLFGQYMVQSHKSLSEDFEVTGRELDILVQQSLEITGCIGSRMTGAGFGGCTVSLIHRDYIDSFTSKVRNEYKRATGLQAEFYVCTSASGARELGIERTVE